jgi:(p)ppGpp synthase/HD superfamily hydrolase
MELLNLSTLTSQEAHASVKHVRKYSGAPYSVHTEEVRAIVQTIYPASNPDNWPVLIAADHHDTIEDVFPLNPYYSIVWIETTFGEHGVAAAKLVWELTDQFTSEAFPKKNRAWRKAAECDRISRISVRGKDIKLSDLISNTSDIVKNDPGFAVTYLKEKYAMLQVLKDGSPILWERANNILIESKELLGLNF